MSAAILRDDRGNAFSALADRARHTSAAALVSLEAVSLGLALSIYWLAPTQWRLILLCLALGALGVWGVLDHEIARYHRRSSIRRMLRAIQSFVAAAGILAGVAGFYFLFATVIGTFIS
jgi:hypothetical protein